jgi:hypothetical protein
MAEKLLNLEKEAHLLSGKERARLIIKDAHEKAFGDKRGFLTDAERNALLRMPDYKVSEDYKRYLEIYEKTPVIMGVITETYLRFKYHYETLKKAHLLLNLSPAVDYLAGIIDEHISDEKAKKEALKITDMIQALEISPDGKLTFKDIVRFIKETVPQVYEQACYFVSMRKIVERMNEELGFNIFIGKRYNEAYQNYIEEVNLSIKEHNEIMKKAGKDIEDLKDYLIKEPTHNTNVYEEWAEILFGEKP